MSIQISRESWHFKLVKFFFDQYSNGLCQYVRRLILSMCIAAALCVVACGGVWFLFGLPIKFGLSFFYDIAYTKEQLVLTYISLAVWVIGLVGISGVLIKDRIESNPDRKPSVFVEYIKAKKQKVCPNIEFV